MGFTEFSPRLYTRGSCGGGGRVGAAGRAGDGLRLTTILPVHDNLVFSSLQRLWRGRAEAVHPGP